MGSAKYHPLLAGFSKSGKPWVNSLVKKQLGVGFERKILKHQRTFLKKIEQGKSWSEARKAALRAEHKGMTKRQRQSYEGKLGALERKLIAGVLK